MKNQNIKTMIWLIIALSAAILSAQTYISGTVSGVWSSSGSPYFITDSIYVPSGSELRILPGVEIFFMGWYPFVIDENASLKAIGNEEDTIFITALDTILQHDSGGHRGFEMENCQLACSLVYCDISFGRGGYREGFGNDHTGALSAQNCSKLLIENCAFRKCEVFREGTRPLMGFGGAVNIRYSDSVIIKGNLFEYCFANSIGGAISVKEVTDIVITDNILRNNIAHRDGGGLHIQQNSTGIIGNNLFYQNSCGRYGGGLYSASSNVYIKNNIFQLNWAAEREDTAIVVHYPANGGALTIGCYAEEISGNLFIGNESEYSNLMYDNWCFCSHKPRIVNNVFLENKANIAACISTRKYPNGIELINNTFAFNESLPDSCIYEILENTALCAANNIFHGNRRISNVFNIPFPEDYIMYVNINSTFTRNTLIDEETPIDITIGPGIYYENPDFYDVGDDNFHLSEDSPAIDRGLAEIEQPTEFGAYTVRAPSIDFDGNERPYGAYYDIGAYEFNPDNVATDTERIDLKFFNVVCSPNPFTEKCVIDFKIGPSQLDNNTIKMDIIDSQGRLIESIKRLPYNWKPGKSIPSGKYFVRINIGKFTECKEIELIR